ALHMVSDVPVGVFLSAGLDSATIGALACERHPGQLRSITLGFEEYRGSANDETGAARLLAESIGTIHQERWIRREAFESEFEALLAAMDQPSIDGINTYFVSKAAAGLGIKVALSGLGGDELFGGYPSFREVPKIARMFRPFASVPAVG